MATLIIVIINVVVCVALKAIAASSTELSNWMVSLLGLDGSGFEAIVAQPWSLLTYMFTHIRASHLLMNMLWLFSFGIILEKAYGWRPLLLAYLLGGLVGGITFILCNASVSAPLLVGSSAAVLSVAFTAIASGSIKFSPLPNSLRNTLVVLALLTAVVFILLDYAAILNNNYVHISGGIVGLALGGTLLWQRRKSIAKTSLQAERKNADNAMLGKVSSKGFASLTAAERERVFNISIANNSKSRQ